MLFGSSKFIIVLPILAFVWIFHSRQWLIDSITVFQYHRLNWPVTTERYRHEKNTGGIWEKVSHPHNILDFNSSLNWLEDYCQYTCINKTFTVYLDNYNDSLIKHGYCNWRHSGLDVQTQKSLVYLLADLRFSCIQGTIILRQPFVVY